MKARQTTNSSSLFTSEVTYLSLAEGFLQPGLIVESNTQSLDLPVPLPTLEVSGPKESDEDSQLAVWLYTGEHDFTSSLLLRGITEVTDNRLAPPLIGHATGTKWAEVVQSERRFLLSLLRRDHVSALITWYVGGEQNLDVLEMLKAKGIPLIFIDRHPPTGLAADYVGTDNERIGIAAIQYLASLGHRRIAMLSNIDAASTIVDRESGYEGGLRTRGLQFDPELVVRQRTESWKGLRQDLLRLLSLPDPPSALFALNDLLAVQGIQALEELGADVPESISVVGVDGRLRWLPRNGALTSIHQDFRQIGRHAAELALLKSKAPGASLYRHVLVPAELIPADSTSARIDRPDCTARF